MSADQAWEALKNGDRAQAERLFVSALESDNRDLHALLGLARVRILQKRLDDAQKVAQAASALDNNVLVQILEAELLGARGNRKESIERLGHILSMNADMPLAQAVLAEQQIRMGFWDGGTKLFTRALTTEPYGAIFLQLQKVCADMTEAVAAGKVSAEDAARFTNKLDSALPRNQPHIGSFLATVRRALSSGQALDLTQLARTASAPASAPAANSQPARSQQPTSHAAQHAAQHTAPRPQRSRPAPPPPRAAHVPAGRAGSFLKSMQEEREQNATLQNMLEPLPPVLWPSDRTEMLDNIALVPAQTYSISELFQINRRQVMQLTDGSILTEIYLERARHALELVQRGALGQPVTYNMAELSRLEINMFDGIMKTLPPIMIADLGVEIATRPELAALGAMIGECVARRFQGTWDYSKDQPERSVVIVGGVKLDPFGVAARWLAAGSSEESGLGELVGAAQAAVPVTGALLSAFAAHIDLTDGLTGRLLDVRLAEQWALYRNASLRANVTELANDLEVTLDLPALVVFTLPKRWLPPNAKLVDERGALIYMRATGEFLCGWLPRAAARAARAAGKRLDDVSGGAVAVMQVLLNTLVMGGVPIGDEATARRLNNQLGREVVDAPRVHVTGVVHRLTLWSLHHSKDLHKWTLEAPVDDAQPWKIKAG